MNGVIRVILGRIVGAIVAALVTWLTSKGITIPPEASAQFIEALVTGLVTVFTIVYSIVHTTVNARINPTDVSSPAKAEMLKRSDDLSKYPVSRGY